MTRTILLWCVLVCSLLIAHRPTQETYSTHTSDGLEHLPAVVIVTLLVAVAIDVAVLLLLLLLLSSVVVVVVVLAFSVYTLLWHCCGHGKALRIRRVGKGH